jgi:20S proteasome alpha/beta subunit
MLKPWLPHPRPPTPKPSSLPKKKHVTIALGLVAHGGFVLAADTQETAGDFKVDQPKILSGNVSGNLWHGGCAIAGAGHGGYIDAIGQQLLERFMHDDKMRPDQWPRVVEDILQRFYAKHVIPFGFQDERLDFSLIVATQRNGVASQLVTNKTTVRPINWHTAIGVGEMAAKGLFNDIGAALVEARTAALLAAYFVFQVKRSVNYCGHFTQVTIVRGNRAVSIPVAVTAEWERAFWPIESISSRVIRYALGHPAFVPDTQEVDRLREQLIKARSAFDQLLSQTLDPLFAEVTQTSPHLPPTVRPARRGSKRDW